MFALWIQILEDVRNSGGLPGHGGKACLSEKLRHFSP